MRAGGEIPPGYSTLLTDVQLGQDQAGVVQGCEQVNLAAVGLGRSAKALAVDRQAAQPAPG
ncbi:hypothetical protein AB0L42_29175 [Streptomyces sp. NPDC052287]|uniref:hypothetical protein n=1 Tax=Streptomyces sp. NPDC052287 TaxID=3154950 RepID=UPI00342354EA